MCSKSSNVISRLHHARDYKLQWAQRGAGIRWGNPIPELGRGIGGGESEDAELPPGHSGTLVASAYRVTGQRQACSTMALCSLG